MVTPHFQDHIFDAMHDDHIQAHLAITAPLSRIHVWEEEDLQEHLHSHNFDPDTFNIDSETFSYGYRDMHYCHFNPRFPSPDTALDPDFQFQSRTIYGIASLSPLPPPPSHRVHRPIEHRHHPRYTPSIGSSSPYQMASPIPIPVVFLLRSSSENIDPSDLHRQTDPLPLGITEHPGNPDHLHVITPAGHRHFAYSHSDGHFDQWYFDEEPDFPYLMQDDLEIPRGSVNHTTSGTQWNRPQIQWTYATWKQGATGFVRTAVGWRPRLSDDGDDWFWISSGIFITDNQLAASLEEHARRAAAQQAHTATLRPPTLPASTSTPTLVAPPAPIVPRPNTPPRPAASPPGLFTPIKPQLPSPVPTMSSNPAPTTTSNAEISVKPEPFEGDRAKSKEFKMRIRLFLKVNQTKYASEDAKIALFLDLCQGPIAGIWATQHGEEILEDDDIVAAGNKPDTANGKPRFDTFVKLLARFDSDFKPLNDSAEAQVAINHLSMGTQPVVDYIMEFEALSPRTGYDNIALVHFFKKGLNRALFEKCMTTYPTPKDLNDWKGRAHDCNAQWLELQCEQRARLARNTTLRTPGMAGHTTTPAAARSPQRAITLTKLSEQECQCLSKEGACFRCRQKGHMSFECPQNQTPCVGALETGTVPVVAPAPQADTRANALATPSGTLAVAALASSLRALGSEEREEARAALKDLIEHEDF
ncbi:hypothetical protein EVG20_g9270 [Dentipellis fragilis]|uniref:CCHC-type domain-containing protein n=1 Tax=Dentipellis fragilis TaxID=205917 RepID=A0A4Y9XZK0_9AGAM|nr:hypothetical protein EVG20_g9270 [Dentipellis fragilis]